MKTLLASITGIAVLLFGGWQFGATAGNGYPMEEAEPIDGIFTDKITGIWHSYPFGLVIQFNPDGSANFGVDDQGRSFGFEAETRTEGAILSIMFTNYDGHDDLCQATAGVYQVQAAVDGAIKFVVVDDQCQLRLNMLQGAPDWGFERIFHPLG